MKNKIIALLCVVGYACDASEMKECLKFESKFFGSHRMIKFYRLMIDDKGSLYAVAKDHEGTETAYAALIFSSEKIETKTFEGTSYDKLSHWVKGEVTSNQLESNLDGILFRKAGWYIRVNTLTKELKLSEFKILVRDDIIKNFDLKESDIPVEADFWVFMNDFNVDDRKSVDEVGSR